MERIRLFAGECTTTFEGTRERTQRGHVVVLVKPDRTVLVHDADGYQPVAWLTRPDSLTVETDEAGFGLVARTGEQTLRVASHSTAGLVDYPASAAGVPVGRHPKTGEALVRTGGAVLAVDSGDQYPLPAGATVLDEPCDDCGLPLIRVERGDVLELCVDRGCESLDDAVRGRFDREWPCPDCGSGLRILRRGRQLLAGCEAHPDCETAVSIPAGVAVGDCPCGLPVFETAGGRRCLDGTCEEFVADDDGRTRSADDREGARGGGRRADRR